VFFVLWVAMWKGFYSKWLSLQYGSQLKNAGQDKKQKGSKQKTHRSTIGEHRFVVLLFVTFLVVWSVQVFAGSF
jgi:hypothetical protein|tara:strand:+ start:90 stop:311 length:222 start_codon:yes stop_codon:yes gene_type:complete